MGGPTERVGGGQSIYNPISKTATKEIQNLSIGQPTSPNQPHKEIRRKPTRQEDRIKAQWFASINSSWLPFSRTPRYTIQTTFSFCLCSQESSCWQPLRNTQAAKMNKVSSVLWPDTSGTPSRSISVTERKCAAHICWARVGAWRPFASEADSAGRVDAPSGPSEQKDPVGPPSPSPYLSSARPPTPPPRVISLWSVPPFFSVSGVSQHLLFPLSSSLS